MSLNPDLTEIRELSAVLSDEPAIEGMRAGIESGAVYVVRDVADVEFIRALRQNLSDVGRGSLPNYLPISRGAPNFHRINRFDDRAYVKGCFHQFSFFPWNDDVFGLFERFREVYALKNRLSGLTAEKFVGREPDDGCTARISVQFYPSGGGMLNRHADPVDAHQLTVPTMLISEKGRDFETGGAYVERDGRRVPLDDFMAPGDVVYFNARMTHGVEPVDPDRPLRWLGFEGRWVIVFAVNKLAGNASIGNSMDLGKRS